MYIEFSYPEFLSDGRDRSVIRFYLPPKLGQPSTHDIRYREQHTAVHIAALWGPDRDQRLIALLAGLYLRNREMLEQLVAVRQEGGRLYFWCRSDEHLKELQRALEDTAEAVLWQRGSWKIKTGQVVPCKGTIVDWERLPADHPIVSAAKGQRLGLIAAHGAQ